MRSLRSKYLLPLLLISAVYSTPSQANWLHSLGRGFCAVIVGAHALGVKKMYPLDYRFSVLSMMRREAHTQEQIGMHFLQVLNYPPNRAHFNKYVRQFPFYIRRTARHAIARADYIDLMNRLIGENLISWDEKTNTYRRSPEGDQFLMRITGIYADLRKDIDPNGALGEQPNQLGVPVTRYEAVLGFIWRLRRDKDGEITLAQLKASLEDRGYENAVENLTDALEELLELGFISQTPTGYDYTIEGQKELARTFALYHVKNAPYLPAIRAFLRRFLEQTGE